MIKKYYDENGHVVGVSYGELTDNSTNIAIDDVFYIIDRFRNMPTLKGHKTYLKEEKEYGHSRYEYEYEKIPESGLSDDVLKDVLQQQILDSITVAERPASKEGYVLKPVLNGSTICWEFEKIDGTSDESHEATGTYIDPIQYVAEMEVETGKWYTDGDNIWEALKNGVPTGFDDREYFDIIG